MAFSSLKKDSAIRTVYRWGILSIRYDFLDKQGRLYLSDGLVRMVV
jgi:hypothetical protein